MLKIDLSGKTALVTGASGQIGRKIAVTLAKCGADIIFHYYSNKEITDALCNTINNLGKKAYICQADITQADSVEKMKENLQSNFRLPHIVVNCAVIRYKWKYILEQDIDDFNSQLNSSVIHNVLTAKAFIPNMIAEKWGRFISLNTECVMECGEKQGAYVSGKRGMDGLLRVLAKEVAEHQITVNQVAPGWVISDSYRDNKSIFSEDEQNYFKKVPMKRRGEETDVANLVAFLASDLANFITGTIIPVSGGTVMPAI